MKAAIYARYSTDQQREASIEDQARNCERLAQREGWTITDRYSDKAVSGTKKDRIGYQAMLADAKEKRFDVLLVDDLSRLSRDDIEIKQTIRRLKFWSIRVIGVSDGFDSDSKGHKIQATVRGMMNEIYLDDLAEKTHRGLMGQALKGNNTGGRAYGYRHVPIEDTSRKDLYGKPIRVGARREKDPEQAKVVKQIFTWYAEGYSPKWIADELNKRQIPSPGSSWNRTSRRCKSWLGSTINSILDNPVYIGRVIWNRSEWIKDPDTGVRKCRKRDESEWIMQEQPTLRIVPQRLWEAVRERRKASATLYHNQCPDHRPRLKYLFSGLLRCQVCGAAFVSVNQRDYACSSYANGGKHACSNNLRVPRKVVEDKLLEGIKQELFTPEAIAEFRQELARQRAERKKAHPPEAAQRELARVEQEIENLVAAIKAGTFSPTLKTALEQAEAERDRLLGQVQGGAQQVDNIIEFLPRIVERFKALVEDLVGVSHRDLARARHQIKTLLGGPIRLKPTQEGYLVAEMAGSYAGLLRLVSGKTNAGLRGSGGRI